MNFVVIGTDHRFQNSEAGFEALLQGWLKQDYFEPLTAIAEEYHDAIGSSSVAQKLANQYGLHWYSLDMTTPEKHSAGILEEQSNRPGMFQEMSACRLPSDDIRENVWVEKLSEAALGTTLVICGYLHFEPLVQKLRAKGYTLDKRVYLETVPTIKLLVDRARES
jgi:hypothetical protein